MTVLFLTNHYMDANGGGTFATRAFVNAFCEAFGDCVFVYPDRGAGGAGAVDARCHLRPITERRHPAKKWLDLWLGKIHRFTPIFSSLLDEVNPDLVVFDNSRCSAGLIDVAKKRGIKTVVIHHNCEYEYYRDELKRQTGFLKTWFMNTGLAYHVKKTERHAVRAADMNLTLTRADVVLLQKYHDQEQSSPFSVLGCFESQSTEQGPVASRGTVAGDVVRFIVTGNLSAYQTHGTLSEFLPIYHPLLAQCASDFELVVAGRNPSADLMRLCADFKGVNVVPNPVRMDDLLEKADIYVCPADSGGGIKLRIMDGLRNGLPVVAHECAVRGYEEFLEAGFLCSYTDGDSFVQAVNRALGKRGEREGIVRLYAEIFGFRSGVTRLLKCLAPLQG